MELLGSIAVFKLADSFGSLVKAMLTNIINKRTKISEDRFSICEYDSCSQNCEIRALDWPEIFACLKIASKEKHSNCSCSNYKKKQLYAA